MYDQMVLSTFRDARSGGWDQGVAKPANSGQMEHKRIAWTGYRNADLKRKESSGEKALR